jgi:S1-C subfamily serine protease
MNSLRPLLIALLAVLIAAPLAAQSGNAWLGVNVEIVPADEARRMGIPGGLKVTNVNENSPAAEAGLEVNDIILSACDQTVTTIEQMQELMGKLHPGDFLSLGVRRANGRNEPLMVTLGAVGDRDDPHADDARVRELRDRLRELDRERRQVQEELDRRRADLDEGRAERETRPTPSPEPEADRPESVPVPPERLELRVAIGASFNNLRLSEASELGIEGGIRVTRLQGSGAAAEAGLKTGDVVTHINGEVVKGTGHLRLLLSNKSPGDVLELSILRDGETKEMRLSLRPR